MSGAISSPWLSQNELYYPRLANQQLAEGEQKYTQNQLLQQQTQQTIGANETQAVARAAGALYSMNEADAAVAYPGMLATLRGQGYKLANAPSSYPGHTAIGALLQGGMSPTEQISSGMIMPPGLAGDLARSDKLLGVGGGTGGTGGTGGQAPYPAPAGAYGQGGKGAATEVPKEYLPYYQEASAKYGIPVDLLIAQHRQESNFNPNARGRAGEIGLGQIMPSTARAPGYGMASVDPATLTDPRSNIMFSAEYLARRMRGDPRDPEVQRRALVAYNGGGDPNYVANVTRYLPGSYPQTQTAAIQAQPTPPQSPGGVVPARTTTAEGPPPPAVPSGPGATNPQSAPGGTTPPAPYQVASTQPVPPPSPTAPPAATPVGTEGLVRNQDGSVGTPGAGGLATPPPPPPPPAPPPAAQPTPTGVNSPQFQEAAQLQAAAADLLAKYPTNPAAKARAAALQQRATLLLQADSVSYDPATGIGTKAISGERVNAAQPLPHYVQDPKTGAYVDTTGTHPPVTPPSPRMMSGPGGIVLQSKPGGGAEVVYQPNAEVTRPAGADYERQTSAYTADIPTAKAIGEAGRTAQASAVQLNELADVISRVKSGGAFPELRARAAAILQANGVSQETVASILGTSGTDAQLMQKLAVATIGANAKTDLGSNVGVESLNLYAGANPGLDKLQDANKRVTNMIRVARAQIDSYTQGAQTHFNENQDKLLHSRQGQPTDYRPLSEYNATWQAQNNPQIGAAAIGILNGDSFDSWAGRASPAEAQQAVRLAARIDPNIKIPVAGGGFKTARDILGGS